MSGSSTLATIQATMDADTSAMALDLAELTSAPVAKTLTLLAKTATSGTQAALVASQTFCRSVTLQAKKVTGANAGNIFIGMAAVSVGDAEVFELTPGQPITIDGGPGTKIDLNTIFIDVDTTGDGVVGLYVPV